MDNSLVTELGQLLSPTGRLPPISLETRHRHLRSTGAIGSFAQEVHLVYLFLKPCHKRLPVPFHAIRRIVADGETVTACFILQSSEQPLPGLGVLNEHDLGSLLNCRGSMFGMGRNRTFSRCSSMAQSACHLRQTHSTRSSALSLRTTHQPAFLPQWSRVLRCVAQASAETIRLTRARLTCIGVSELAHWIAKGRAAFDPALGAALPRLNLAESGAAIAHTACQDGQSRHGKERS